jgi:MFS family permease
MSNAYSAYSVRGRTLAVAAAGTVLVLAVFSAFVVTVGDSARSLGAGLSSETWALSGMSLGLAAALLTAGSLADDYGHRRVLTSSAGLLALASVGAALAPGIAVLIGARVLQGAAGGGLLSASLGSIGRAFEPGPSLSRATGIWGAAVGGGIALGPVAGAALSATFGWRSAFWAEALAAAAVLVGTMSIPESRPAAGHRLDLSGVSTLTAGMSLLVAAVVEVRRPQAGIAPLALLAAAVLFLAAFAVVERRRRRPMLETSLFAEPRFLASIFGALFTGLAVVGLMSFCPSLMQTALHLSALDSAGVLAAWSGTSAIVALASRSLPARVSSQTRLVVGLALAAGGELALSGLSGNPPWTRLVPGLLVAGIGSGIANAALGRITVESVPPERAGMGSGANNTARYLGGAAGVALTVSIASSGGSDGLIQGWNSAAMVSAGLCALGALIVAGCRPRS